MNTRRFPGRALADVMAAVVAAAPGVPWVGSEDRKAGVVEVQGPQPVPDVEVDKSVAMQAAHAAHEAERQRRAERLAANRARRAAESGVLPAEIEVHFEDEHVLDLGGI